jgi:hypothetical protein
MCDLGLSIEGTPVEARIAQLNSELQARGLVCPNYYLSDEWFTPDGIPASPYRSIWRIRGSKNSNWRKCSKWKAPTTPAA